MSISSKNETWLRGGEQFRGQRLLPHVIDYHAHEAPGRVFACVPKSQDVADGFEDIDMNYGHRSRFHGLVARCSF